MVVKPRMSENSTVSSRLSPPSVSISGCSLTRVRQRRRQVQTEGVADLALLALLDDVVLHADGGVRQADRQQRIDQAERQADGEEEPLAPHQVGRQQSQRHERAVHAAREVQRHAEEQDRQQDHADLDEAQPPRLKDEVVPQDVVDRGGVDLDPGQLAVERRGADVGERRGGDADEHELAAKRLGGHAARQARRPPGRA